MFALHLKIIFQNKFSKEICCLKMDSRQMFCNGIYQQRQTDTKQGNVNQTIPDSPTKSKQNYSFVERCGKNAFNRVELKNFSQDLKNLETFENFSCSGMKLFIALFN